MADKLLVATSTFITKIDGKRMVITAGKSRVRSSHPVVQGREHLFVDADTRVDVERATAEPGEKRTLTRKRKTSSDDDDGVE